MDIIRISSLMMKHVLLLLCLLKIHHAEARCNNHNVVRSLGEGNCNSDKDCKDGLICDTHGWSRKETCVAGPKTKNYELTEWGEWSECSTTTCGDKGIRRRTRSCTPPEFGGLECPSDETIRYFQVEGCLPVCSKATCSPNTWLKFTWDCCTPDSPCFEGEGDCDSDDDCDGDLTCGENNCPHGFPARLGIHAPDCCEPPASMSTHLLNYNNCDGKCKQGEGDCDSDNDCMEGLLCDFDNWVAKDFCIAGPNTRDGVLTEWTEWSECSTLTCGVEGTQLRSRTCIDPMFGGNDCPESALLEQLRKCTAANCPVGGGETVPKKSKPTCNPATWEKFTWNCCTKNDPCYEGEGDCDFDSECADGLVCAKNSCPPTFTARFGRSKPDCCAKPR